MSIKLYEDGRIVTKVNGIPTTYWPNDEGYQELYEQATPVQPVVVALPTTEELAVRVRTERDARITACDWIISRHAEQVALGVDTTLTSDEYAEWLGYRQELRDLPSEDGFPWDGGGEETPWPVEPDGEDVSVSDGFEEGDAESIL